MLLITRGGMAARTLRSDPIGGQVDSMMSSSDGKPKQRSADHKPARHPGIPIDRPICSADALQLVGSSIIHPLFTQRRRERESESDLDGRSSEDGLNQQVAHWLICARKPPRRFPLKKRQKAVVEKTLSPLRLHILRKLPKWSRGGGFSLHPPFLVCFLFFFLPLFKSLIDCRGGRRGQ